MSGFININKTRNMQDAPISQDWGNDVVDDLNFLNGVVAGVTDADGVALVVNGSFEVDANNSTTVSNWTVVLGSGATGIVTNSDQNHGAQSFKFTRDSTVGHNGGSLTSQFMNCSPNLEFLLGFMLKCSRSDVENTVQVSWYTATQSLISTTTVYDSGLGSNAPTTWNTIGNSPVTPPATAMFFKIILNAGIAAQTPGATTSIFFDGVFVRPRTALSNLISYTSPATFTVPSGTFRVRLDFGQKGFVTYKGTTYGFNAGPNAGFINIDSSSGSFMGIGTAVKYLSVNPGDTISVLPGITPPLSSNPPNVVVVTF